VDFVLIGYIFYRVAGAAAESTFTVSGFIVAVVSVATGDTVLLPAAVESVLPDGIELSFVPQLTANNPRPRVNNNNFFITNFILVYYLKFNNYS